jgi:hypothetical protein
MQFRENKNKIGKTWNKSKQSKNKINNIKSNSLDLNNLNSSKKIIIIESDWQDVINEGTL